FLTCAVVLLTFIHFVLTFYYGVTLLLIFIPLLPCQIPKFSLLITDTCQHLTNERVFNTVSNAVYESSEFVFPLIPHCGNVVSEVLREIYNVSYDFPNKAIFHFVIDFKNLLNKFIFNSLPHVGYIGSEVF